MPVIATPGWPAAPCVATWRRRSSLASVRRCAALVLPVLASVAGAGQRGADPTAAPRCGAVRPTPASPTAGAVPEPDAIRPPRPTPAPPSLAPGQTPTPARPTPGHPRRHPNLCPAQPNGATPSASWPGHSRRSSRSCSWAWRCSTTCSGTSASRSSSLTLLIRLLLVPVFRRADRVPAPDADDPAGAAGPSRSSTRATGPRSPKSR